MKTIFSAVAIVCSAAALYAAQPRWTYESPQEFFISGDFDGDGLDDLAVVAKASGTLQLQNAMQNESRQWSSAASSGFSNVTGVASGRLLATTRDALAFTSPEANRINVLSLMASATWAVSNFYVTNHGPVTLATLDIGGAGNNTAVDDLFIGSIWDGTPGNQRSTWRNTLSGLTALGANTIGDVPLRANAVMVKTNLPAHAAMILRGSTNDTLLVSSNYSGVPQTTLSGVLLSGADYIAAQFETNSPLARFLLWQAGSSNLTRIPVTEPSANNFALGTRTGFFLGVPIGSVFALPGSNSFRLLVIHSGGTTQSIYDWDGTTTAPSLVFRTNAPPGETFTGAMPFGSHGFVSLTCNNGSGRTTTSRTTRWTGSTYTNGAPMILPSTTHFAAQANILLFNGEPFVATTPELLAQRNASDWSSGVRLVGSVTATQETFVASSSGVSGATLVNIGAIPASANFGMANQVSNFMSVFSLARPVGDTVSEVRISPTPGNYNSAVTVTLTPANNAHQAWYRLNNTGAWSLYTAPFVVSATASVSYYGKPIAGAARSIVRTAAFSITAPPATLDSDGDGVPDYVERDKGLDPTKGRDSDGDGWSDFEELAYGSDANSAASIPVAGSTPLSLNAGFLIEARPKPRDPLSDQVVKAELGTIVRLHQLPGASLGEQLVSLPAERAARFSNVVADVSHRLLAISTEPHFDIETTNTDTRIGRELLTLLPIPGYAPIAVTNSLYTGTNSFADASNWLTAAVIAVTSAPPRVIDASFVKFDTLSALLTEKKFGDLLVQRGTNWGTNLTLFPTRAGDATRSNAPIEILRALERYAGPAVPAHRLTTVFETISSNVSAGALAGVTALKTLTTEIYRISMLSNNGAPGVYPLPADALREFVAGGPVHSNYAPVINFTSNQTVLARSGISNLLASPLPRAVTNVWLRARADYCGDGATRVLLLDNLTSGGVAKLVDAEGKPFSFPQSFTLLPGSELNVTAFTDAEPSSDFAATCRSNVLEVISAELLGVPIASDPDLDGNLLIDSWEQQFLGSTTSNAFADNDGDGYQDLQEMLSGTDPKDANSRPTGSVAFFGRPAMRATTLPNGDIALRWSWPGAYASAFVFGLRVSADVTTPFSEVATSVSQNGNELTVVVPSPAAPLQFFNLVVRLR